MCFSYMPQALLPQDKIRHTIQIRQNLSYICRIRKKTNRKSLSEGNPDDIVILISGYLSLLVCRSKQ